MSNPGVPAEVIQMFDHISLGVSDLDRARGQHSHIEAVCTAPD